MQGTQNQFATILIALKECLNDWNDATSSKEKQDREELYVFMMDTVETISYPDRDDDDWNLSDDDAITTALEQRSRQ
jgi:hypothetical protein